MPNLRTSYFLMAAGLLTPLAIGAAHAVTDTAFNYSAPKTGFYVIESVEMQPNQSGTQWQNDFLGDGLRVTTGTGCFAAPLHLPNGAILTHAYLYYASGNGGNPSFVLLRKKLLDNTIGTIGGLTVADDTGVRKAAALPVTASMAAINNGAYSYLLSVCMSSSNDVFYASRIHYTYANAGD
jgi:hypothetical protein